MRAGALGDLLLLRPAIAALQDAGRTVGLLAPSGPAAALVGSTRGDVADLLRWESADFAPLMGDGIADDRVAGRLRAYGAAIVYSRDRALAASLGRLIPTVVTHDPAPPPGHHAARWLASCLPAIGVTAREPPAAPILEPSSEERRAAGELLSSLPSGFLALHPGSGSPSKNWPADRFAALARAIAPRRWLLVHGPADDAAAGALAEVPGACVARDLPLRVLAAVLARASVYVGNDSGVTHLAAASGAPTVGLFGATDPAVWAPLGRHVEIVAARTMEAITVDAVAAAVARVRSGARGLPCG